MSFAIRRFHLAVGVGIDDTLLLIPGRTTYGYTCFDHRGTPHTQNQKIGDVKIDRQSATHLEQRIASLLSLSRLDTLFHSLRSNGHREWRWAGFARR